MQNQPKILIIEDELQIRRVLRLTLEAKHFQISEAANGKDGIYQAATFLPDVILLDLGLPDMDGQTVLLQIREWSKVPIIILSVRDDEKGKVAALEAGADDYVTKPFGVEELIARLHVALRHGQKPENELHLFSNSNLHVDLVNRIVNNGDAQVRLTATEYSLLVLFVKNPGKVLTYNYLIKSIWGRLNTEDSRSLRVHMARLRKKLESDPENPTLFITESGVGYRMMMIEEG
jgi:two-component system KDP operon response regulator KdpE